MDQETGIYNATMQYRTSQLTFSLTIICALLLKPFKYKPFPRLFFSPFIVPSGSLQTSSGVTKGCPKVCPTWGSLSQLISVTQPHLAHTSTQSSGTSTAVNTAHCLAKIISLQRSWWRHSEIIYTHLIHYKSLRNYMYMSIVHSSSFHTIPAYYPVLPVLLLYQLLYPGSIDCCLTWGLQWTHWMDIM